MLNLEDALNEISDLKIVVNGLRRMMVEQKKEIERLKEELAAYEAADYDSQQEAR